MARQTGQEAQWSAVLAKSHNDGIKACKEFYGLPWDWFYEGNEHPEIKIAFRNGWLSQAEKEAEKL